MVWVDFFCIYTLLLKKTPHASSSISEKRKGKHARLFITREVFIEINSNAAQSRPAGRSMYWWVSVHFCAARFMHDCNHRGIDRSSVRRLVRNLRAFRAHPNGRDCDIWVMKSFWTKWKKPNLFFFNFKNCEAREWIFKFIDSKNTIFLNMEEGRNKKFFK